MSSLDDGVVPVELEDVPMTGWAVLVFNRSSDGRRRIFKPTVW